MKKIPLVAQILIGFGLGTAIGLALCEFASPDTTGKILPFVAPFGSVLVAMLKMVVYPIILFSLIMGAASLPLKTAGKVGGTVLAWYGLTSLFATVFGVVVAYALNPSLGGVAKDVAAGHMADAQAFAGGTGAASSSFGAFLMSFFENPFSALANGHFLAIIVFAVAFGLAARWILDNEKTDETERRTVQTVLDFCDGAQRISFRLIDCVVAYFPYGVFALTLTNFAQHGTLLFGPYAKITLCVTVGVAAMIFVIYPIAIGLCCRENPYRVLMRMRQPMLTAFVTRSSAATLPVSFKAMDDIGVDRVLSSFSLPMGATVNMNGVCVHLPVFVVLAANMYHLNLGLLDIGTLCLLIVFAAIGAGGVPGGSVFLLFMVLENMHLSPEQTTLVVALALGINPILDMFETCCNVAGDLVCTYIVAKRNGLATNFSVNRL